MENEIPTDGQVVAALAELGDSQTAAALCRRLVAKGHPLGDSQLAIQRTIERGKICFNDDWSLSVVLIEEPEAA